MVLGLVGSASLAIVGMDFLATKVGYERLARNERKNREFIERLGIVSYIYAEMGEGRRLCLRV